MAPPPVDVPVEGIVAGVVEGMLTESPMTTVEELSIVVPSRKAPMVDEGVPDAYITEEEDIVDVSSTIIMFSTKFVASW